MVARRALSILGAGLIAVTGTTFSWLPTAASDVSCDRYAWPNYPAECPTSEDGVAATKTGRRIVPGGYDPLGSEVRIVVARQQGLAPIAATYDTTRRPANLVEISGKATTFDPFAESAPAHPVNADPQPSTLRSGFVQSARLPDDYVEVTVWRGARPTTYLVRSNR